MSLEREFVEHVVDNKLEKLKKAKVELVFSGLGIISLFLILREAIIELPLNDPSYQSTMELLLQLEDVILRIEPEFEKHLAGLTVLNEGEEVEKEKN